MHAKYLVLGVTVSALLGGRSTDIVSAQHANDQSIKGPLLEAAREVTARFRQRGRCHRRGLCAVSGL